jgi:hypothetical protein
MLFKPPRRWVILFLKHYAGEEDTAMNLIIDVPSPIGARIQEEAEKAGVTPTEIAARALIQSFSPPPFDTEEQKRLNAPSIAHLQSWLEEANRPRTAEEAAEAEADLTQLMHNLNAPRKEAGERLLFPEVEEAEADRVAS